MDHAKQYAADYIKIGINLCMCPANERRYNVTSSLIGWAHTENITYGSDLQLRTVFSKLHSRGCRYNYELLKLLLNRNYVQLNSFNITQTQTNFIQTKYLQPLQVVWQEQV